VDCNDQNIKLRAPHHRAVIGVSSGFLPPDKKVKLGLDLKGGCTWSCASTPTIA
jgi:hypothetical protein